LLSSSGEIVTEQEEVQVKKGWIFLCKNLTCMRQTYVFVTEDAKRAPDYCPFCGDSPDRMAFDPNTLKGME